MKCNVQCDIFHLSHTNIYSRIWVCRMSPIYTQACRASTIYGLPINLRYIYKRVWALVARAQLLKTTIEMQIASTGTQTIWILSSNCVSVSLDFSFLPTHSRITWDLPNDFVKKNCVLGVRMYNKHTQLLKMRVRFGKKFRPIPLASCEYWWGTGGPKL